MSAESGSPVKLPYRPALDGIRALAVVAVLLYHGGTSVRGGYLGVDVFFVLSGYLITTLLLTEARWSGGLDLATFWFHRARRLLPALVLVLGLVAFYSLVFAPDIVRSRLRGDMLASLAYAANWHFIVNGISYFEQYSTPTPLLHTWSLAIEEQFYVLWPLVLLFLLKRFGNGPRWRRAVLVLSAGGVVISAVVMAILYTPGIDPSRVYYGTDTRAQALLVGAAGAVVAHRWGWWTTAQPGRTRASLFELIGAVGAAGVLIAFFVADQNDPWMYRGGFFAVAVLSLALVMAAAAPRRTIVGDLLAIKPLQALGRISYGVYLWHWPLYVILTPTRTGLSGNALLLMRILVTLIVAAFSYVLVERPVRRWSPTAQGNRHRGPWTPRALAAALVAVFACAALAITTTGGAVAPPRPDTTIATASADAPLPNSPASSGTTPSPGPSTDTTSVWLLGDSVAYNLFAQYPPNSSYGVRASGLTRLGCNIAGGELVMDGARVPAHDFCADWPSDWRKDIARAQPDLAILMPGNGELFDHLVDGKTYVFGTRSYADFMRSWIDTDLQDMRKHAKAVGIMTIPCYAKVDSGLDPTPRFVNDPQRQRWANEVIRQYAANNPDVLLFDLREAVCDGDSYAETRDGVHLRTDGVHWTPSGADFVWRWLAGEARSVMRTRPSGSASPTPSP